MAARYLFVDVAHTLLHKPGVVDAFASVLRGRGVDVSRDDVVRRHALATEACRFPMTTSAAFYREFNSTVVRLLGGVVDEALLDELAAACRGVPWVPFDDVGALSRVGVPVGVVSNWDRRLRERLADHVGVDFERVVGSAEAGVEKPDVELYRTAARGLSCDPGEIAYVGDSIRLDVEPALRLGWNAILLDRHDLYSAFRGSRIRTLDELPSLLS